jgi:transcription elongation factor Elf1
MTDSLLSKQRNKILEKFADHILKESCPHCQHIVRQALTVEDGDDYKTHCKKCGEWLEGEKFAKNVVKETDNYLLYNYF